MGVPVYVYAENAETVDTVAYAVETFLPADLVDETYGYVPEAAPQSAYNQTRPGKVHPPGIDPAPFFAEPRLAGVIELVTVDKSLHQRNGLGGYKEVVGLGQDGRAIITTQSIQPLPSLAAHELGHALGLHHCDTEECLMSTAEETLWDADGFCPDHEDSLKKLNTFLNGNAETV